MSVWDDIVKFFGGTPKEDEVDTAPYKEKEKELNDALDKMSEDYSSSHPGGTADLDKIMPKDPNYKKLTYQGDDESTIENKVKGQFDKEKESDINNILLDFESKKNKNKNKEGDIIKSAEDKLNQLASQYEKIKTQNNDSIINRGLAHSSIKNKSEEHNEDTNSQNQESINAEHQSKIDDINKQLSELEKAETQAVSDLDLHYASKIGDKIKKLKGERTNAIEYIDKYNNTIDEKTNKYKVDREKSIQDYISDEMERDRVEEKYEMENGYSGDKKADYDKRLNTAIDFYNQLPANVAKKMINENNYLKTYLGHNFGMLMSNFAYKK